MADKPVNVTLIPEVNEDGKQSEPYRLLAELVQAHHPHLRAADIALAWRTDWKSNADGLLRLGQARKATDLDRELHCFDFVILLNFEVWNSEDFTDAQRRALLDHELCHCQIVLDDVQEPQRDERGRIVWRTRKHDLEEFEGVVVRHGAWNHEVQRLVVAAAEKQGKLPLSG